VIWTAENDSSMLYTVLNVLHVVLLVQVVAAVSKVGHDGGDLGGPKNGASPPTAVYSITSMSYAFGFPSSSCDVNVVQTIEVNYTSGNFTSGFLFLPRSDYDSLQIDHIMNSDNVSLPFTYISDGDLYRIHYNLTEHVIAPATGTYTFMYKAMEATKTFSRSGSSSNSFSWETVTSKSPYVDTLNVMANLYFHTATEDAIESSPQSQFIQIHPEYTTVVFPTETDIPEGTPKTHQISFPKRVTCKPASSYKIVAVAVVAASVCFALGTTLIALIIRKLKQVKSTERFEQLPDVT